MDSIRELYEYCSKITTEIIDLEMEILALQIKQDKLRIKLNNELIKVEKIENLEKEKEK